MDVSLKFTKGSYLVHRPYLNIEISGPPAEVQLIIDAIRDAIKDLEDWEEI